MNGTLARLAAAALAASALMLGACVAQTADDEEEPVVQTHAADTFVPMIPETQGGNPPAPPSGNPLLGPVPAGGDQGDPLDPEPSPWKDPTSH